MDAQKINEIVGAISGGVVFLVTIGRVTLAIYNNGGDLAKAGHELKVGFFEIILSAAFDAVAKKIENDEPIDPALQEAIVNVASEKGWKLAEVLGPKAAAKFGNAVAAIPGALLSRGMSAVRKVADASLNFTAAQINSIIGAKEEIKAIPPAEQARVKILLERTFGGVSVDQIGEFFQRLPDTVRQIKDDLTGLAPEQKVQSLDDFIKVFTKELDAQEWAGYIDEAMREKPITLDGKGRVRVTKVQSSRSDPSKIRVTFQNGEVVNMKFIEGQSGPVLQEIDPALGEIRYGLPEIRFAGDV